MADPSPMSAAEIVAAIKDKKITAADVAKAAFARAEQVKDLNALIFLNKDPALAAAAEIDDGGRGPLPLAGLPIVVKDNINTADMPTSAGTPALQNAQPRSQRAITAETVRSRRHRHRQGQHARTGVRHHQHQSVVVRGPGEKPLRQDADSRRLLRRNGGGDCRRHRHLRPRIRYRRIDPRARGAVRHRRIAAVGRQWRRASAVTTTTNMVVPISHTRDTVGPMGRTVADVALLDSVITGTRDGHSGAVARQAPRHSRRRSGTDSTATSKP